MINATMCYLRVDDKILLLNRKPGERDIHHGFYVPPGGKTERGKRGIDCILREYEQETGLRLQDPKLKAIVTFYNEGRILGGVKDPEDWCVEVYVATSFNGALKPESPKAKPVWLTKADLQIVRMHEGDRKLLDLLNQEGVFQVRVKYSGEVLEKLDIERVA